MTETIVSAKKPYDPGKAQPARLVNAAVQLYAIDSFRGEGKSYLVKLGQHPTCSCPDFQKRGETRPCKHVLEVIRQSRYLKLLETARSLSDADLARLLQRYTELGDPETAGAIRVAREERRQAAARKEHIHSIIDEDAPAPVRPAYGQWTKISGPTTDEEARRAIFA